MKSQADSLLSISPLDGRYQDKTAALRDYFSEMALMKYRCYVEIEYFIALSQEKGVKEFPSLSLPIQKKLRAIVATFSLTDAKRIKAIEKKTQHDVKAIEYFLQEKIAKLPCKKYQQFLHFALTSEDINNLSYTLMWCSAVRSVYLPALKADHTDLIKKAHIWAGLPLLSLTHGQSATPTTLGKECAVYCERLLKPIHELNFHAYTGKLNGATGTWAAHTLAYPKVDWISFSKRFIKNLGLYPNILTTQVEGNDSLAQSFLILSRINTILIDFAQDVWLYCSRGVFQLQKKDNEVGSSTMPHKINPIHFENAEGNLKLANALLIHLATTLPVSRLQRDLSGSTHIRNFGIPLAYSLIACKNMLIGLGRIVPDTDKCAQELDEHFEVLTEGIQTVLRKNGSQEAYEQLKKLTRGVSLSSQTLRDLIKQLPLPKNEKRSISKLQPKDYTGIAEKVAKLVKPLSF